MTEQAPTRILSGIQANGELHIGNLIGAIDQWVAGLDQHETFAMLADLHALTTPWTSELSINETCESVTALYIAAGLDPERCNIFRQSALGGLHTELAWYLACVTPIGQLNRMTQFKSKRGSHAEAGLFTYPILQAADIALYRAHYVPVGEDQIQHLELARDIIQRFNSRFSDATLVVPEPRLPRVGSRVMGLDNPAAKMSKSIARTKPAHAILLLDDDDMIRRKITRAVTDSDNELEYSRCGPGVRNLIDIGGALRGSVPETFVKTESVASYGELKDAVVDAAVSRLDPIRRRYASLISDRAYLRSVLGEGSRRARAVAEETLNAVRDAQGLS